VNDDQSRILRFLRLPAKEKLLFIEALINCAGVWLLLKIIPFRMVPGLFSGAAAADCTAEVAKLHSIRTSIRRASRLFPVRNRCLISSLCARLMLRRRKIPSKIFMGVASGTGGRIDAHAWISCGDFEVVAKNGKYNVLFSF